MDEDELNEQSGVDHSRNLRNILRENIRQPCKYTEGVPWDPKRPPFFSTGHAETKRLKWSPIRSRDEFLPGSFLSLFYILFTYL